MLSEAGIQLGTDFSVELSHHYGIERFSEVGAFIVDIVNREYCKKLIVILPGQRHPIHRHKKKEETFQVLHGEMNVTLNDIPFSLKAGDKVRVERGTWHSFESKDGAIFEEVSTTHVIGDSYYVDPAISRLDPIQRKTVVDAW